MMKSTLQIKQICKNIELVITDVDGVLTDGGRYYASEGEKLKKFHVRDGMAVNILLRNKIKTLILTKEKSTITKKWANDMNISEVFSGFTKKEEALKKILKKYGIPLKKISYIGDDVNDLSVLKQVGLAVTPKDASAEVKKAAHYTCKTKGGEGCLREVTDLILLSRSKSQVKWY